MKVSFLRSAGFLGLLLLIGCGDQKPSSQKASDPKTKSALPSLPDKNVTAKNATNRIGNVFILDVDVPELSSFSPAQQADLARQLKLVFEADNRCYEINSAEGLRIRNLLEEIMRHSNGLSPDIRKKIKRYLSLFWLNHGPRDRLSGKLLTPRFIPGELAAAAQIAMEQGAAIDLGAMGPSPLAANRLEEVELLVKRLRPYIFGSDVAATVVADLAQDTVSDSAAPAKLGMDTDSMADGAIDNGVECSPALAYVESPVLSVETAAVLNMAVQLDNRVREVGGRKSVHPPPPPRSVKAVNLIAAGGSDGPLIADTAGLYSAGPVFDLPQPGKLFAVNIGESFFNAVGTKLVAAFSTDQGARNRRGALGLQSRYAYWVLRESFGHGLDGTEAKPADWFQNRLGDTAPILAELRADLAALFLAFDADVQRIGLVPTGEGPRAFIEEYLFGTLAAVAVSPEFSTTVSGRTRLIVLNYLLDRNVLVAPVEGSGDVIFTVADFAGVLPAITELLAEVRRIRFSGDGVASRALVNNNDRMRAILADRLKPAFKAAAVPASVAVVYPVVRMKANADGTMIIDSVQTFDRFFDRQMADGAAASEKTGH